MASEDGILHQTNMQAKKTSSGDAKLVGRPNAGAPNSLSYTKPSHRAAGSGVLTQGAATLNQ